MAEVTLNDLTLTTLDGTGVFDVLMRATKTHLEAEFSKNRFKGPEYATVYLGSLESVMRTSMEFLLQRQKISLEADLMAQQVLIAQAEVQKANAQTDLAIQQVLSAKVELEILTLNKDKIPAEIAHLQSQTALVAQQKANLITEGLNIPKQGLLIDAQTSNTAKQADIATEEILVKKQQVLIAIQELGISQAKLANIPKEGLQLDAQTALTSQQAKNLVDEALGTKAKTSLTTQQTNNAVIEATVLQAQQCKLTAEYDLIMLNKDKTSSETALLTQKIATEKAQTVALGVDDNSVIGKQKLLYTAQTTGFARDAEQKVAKLMTDTWNVRRTTDEGTVADGTNMLSDSVVGRAVTKMLNGIGA